MADEYQTSNELVGRLNAQETVLARGEVSFDVTDSVGGVFLGQGQVNIDYIKTSVANPTFEFYRYVDNGAPSYSRSLSKGGGTIFSFGTGAVTYQDYGSLFWVQENIDPEFDQLRLLISVRSSTSIAEVRYFYIIKSLSITNSDVFVI
jgi:hypothetical protein